MTTRHSLLLRLPLLLSMTLAAWGCVPPLSEGELPCPCAEGWTCCARTQTCKQDAAWCPGGPDATPDDTAPAAPRLDSVQPGSPTSDARVTVAGSAEPGARVRLFTDPTCAGQAIGEGKADTAGGFRVQVDLTPNATTPLYGQAEDAAGNVSLCSAEPLRVTHDDVAPPAPALVETQPASPSSFNTHPVLSGTAEPGARVRVFADATCESPLPFDTAADASGTFRVSVEVQPNTPTTFWARATDAAGNTSGCSGSGLSYAHDDLPPAAPTSFTTNPATPAASLEPLWQAITEPGALVRVFDEADCLGVPLAEVRAGADGRFGVRLAARANAPLTRWLTLTDVAGNTSACRELGTYVHDDVAPSLPVLSRTDPASPSQSMNPSVVGVAEPGATVVLYREWVSLCDGGELGRGQADASGAFRIPITVGNNSYVSVQARAMDAAGNLSPCTTSALWYENDTSPPPAPSAYAFTEPSPSRSSTTPTLVLSIYTPDEDVRLYTDDTCTGPVVANPKTRVSTVYVYIPLSVAPGSTTSFYMTATDKAGNTSACFPVGRYVHVQEGPGWRAPRELPGGDTLAGTDGQGHAFVLANVRDGSLWSALVRRSDDTGEWEPAHVLTSSTDGLKAGPALGVNARGEAVAFWVEWDGSMRAARYSPDAGWESPKELSPASSTSRYSLTAGMDAQGNALVTWVEADSSSYLVRIRTAPAGGDWGEEPGPQRFQYIPQLLEITPSGAVVMGWEYVPDTQTYRVKARVFTHAAGWGEETLIAVDELRFAADVDAGGTVWAAYPRYRPGSGTGYWARYDIWVRSLPPGATEWTEPELLSNPYGIESDDRLQVLGGRAGEAMVASASYYGTVIAHHHPAGGKWGDWVFVGNAVSSADPYKMHFALGRDGEVYAAWVDESGPFIGNTYVHKQALRLRRFDPVSGWEPHVQLLANDNEEVRLYGLAGTPRGELVVLWNQYDGFSVPSTLRTRWLR